MVFEQVYVMVCVSTSDDVWAGVYNGVCLPKMVFEQVYVMVCVSTPDDVWEGVHRPIPADPLVPGGW